MIPLVPLRSSRPSFQCWGKRCIWILPGGPVGPSSPNQPVTAGHMATEYTAYISTTIGWRLLVINLRYVGIGWFIHVTDHDYRLARLLHIWPDIENMTPAQHMFFADFYCRNAFQQPAIFPQYISMIMGYIQWLAEALTTFVLHSAAAADLPWKRGSKLWNHNTHRFWKMFLAMEFAAWGPIGFDSGLSRGTIQEINASISMRQSGQQDLFKAIRSSKPFPAGSK